ncbi:Fatty acid cis/trans isomerase (CTI) [compost metagenome]
MPSFRLFVVSILISASCLASEKAEDIYRSHIQPLFDRRCVACHSCFNAPCQLNLQDFSGFDRGLNKMIVYNGTRTTAVEPTRLWIDGATTAEWRAKGFFDIHSKKNTDENIFWQALELKNKNPDLTIKKQVAESLICPTSINDAKALATSSPELGMPYGLPGLQAAESDVIKTWLQNGAPGPKTKIEMSPSARKQVREWEEFLNEGKLKQKLVSRYLYEHLFLAHIYFPEKPNEFFRLVRSKKSCGTGISEISTRRPNADPGQKNFYYCLRPFNATVAFKTHLPYEFNSTKMERIKKIFFASQWEVTELPSYRNDIAENPFLTFQAIPAKARYEFLLEDAEYQVATFIKGPVCNGSQAVNSIQEQFYAFFLDPDSDNMVLSKKYEAIASQMLVLPGMWGSDVKVLEAPLLYKDLADYREKYRKFRSENLAKTKPEGYRLEDIWDGDGTNPNAVLSIFRHDDNAVVMKGAVGDLPKTVFVLDYPLLERLVYNLVVNFDVFGNVSHQFLTRVYMDMIRMEAEELFLAFLPPEQRLAYRRDWYQGLFTQAKMNYMFPTVGSAEPTGIRYNSDSQTKSQLITKILFFRMNDKVRGAFDPLNWKNLNVPDSQKKNLQISGDAKTLTKITSIKAGKKTPFARFFPDLAYLIIDSEGAPKQVYSIIHNKEHENISWILAESMRMLPEQDSLTLREGFWGSYPNMIFRVNQKDLAVFTKKVSQLKTEEDYKKLVATYGVTRNQTRFWTAYDDLQKVFAASNPTEFGYLDLTRYSLE